MEDQSAAGNRFAVVLRREWDLAGRPSMRSLASKTKKARPALSHGMIYSTLRGDSLPSSWENAKCVVEAVLDFTELSGFRRDAFVETAKEIYVEENKKRVVTRSALRQGAEAQRRVNHALPVQDIRSDDADEEPLGEAVRQAQVLVVERARDLGPNHPDTFDARQELAYWTGKDGSPAKAAMLLRELARDRARVLSPDHPTTLGTRHAEAYWTGTAGNPDEAARLLHLLVIDRARVLGPNHELTQKTRQNAIAWTSMTARCQSG